MSCPKCAKHRLIDIAMTIGEHHVSMHSCNSCGERWWEQDGARVALPAVLEMATTRR